MWIIYYGEKKRYCKNFNSVTFLCELPYILKFVYVSLLYISLQLRSQALGEKNEKKKSYFV